MNGSKSWWLPCFSAQSNTCAKICNTVYVISSATFSFLQRKKQNAFFTIVFVTTNSRCGTRGCSVEVKWAISYVIICRFAVKPFSNQIRTLKSGLIFHFILFFANTYILAYQDLGFSYPSMWICKWHQGILTTREQALIKACSAQSHYR